MEQNEIKEVLRLHKLWTGNDPKGQKAILSGAYLSGANLTGVNLKNANLTGVNLKNANLTGADLSGAYLSGAYLSGAYLSGADLTGAYLSGANLTGADLTGVNLKNASLKNAILKYANLSGATFDKETKFPEGFDPIAHGMIGIILVEEKVSSAPAKHEEVVAAVPAATSSTLHEELSAVLAKHGLTLGKNVTLNINFIG